MIVPLSSQISYMERHRDKGRELLKTKPETQAAVDIADGIILTLTAYQEFVANDRQQEQERNTR
ncbi:hypothetical protein WH87_04885 [Devosia epidermidihirudinis]|uniref:Resolvase/invertase-type recombinase catalytic domain-containing protein n=1 Tax=Devosia epidermidihirudinis TaxID=1293439 RepID=A0A0F5QF09_9HYPH|nr:hypothetical protein [Devosia epidermidihirudinis]KKC39530.1 hypothetical protein WH87_04885 [Devosia epidermidihirudinis]